MKKIPTAFVRNPQDRKLVLDEWAPGCEWVREGYGVATQKLDGTSCLVHTHRLYTRHYARVRFATSGDPDSGRIGVRDGKSEGGVFTQKPPDGFRAADDPDPVTLKVPGWVPVFSDNPGDRWHVEALRNVGIITTADVDLEPGTYELLGPKVQGNPEGFRAHTLVRHPGRLIDDFPRTFGEIRAYFSCDAWDGEGVVWWEDPDRPESRKAKIKARDFGIRRKPCSLLA